MNLTQDILTHLSRTIPPTESASLNGKNAVELMTSYLSWRDQVVAHRPRTAHIGRSFASRLCYDDALDAMVRGLIHDLEIGADIDERTNTLLTDSGLRPGDDPVDILDFLLHEWRISHVVIDSAQGNSSPRSAVVLIAFTDAEAYLIGTHDSQLTLSSVAAALIEDFPDSGFVRAFPEMGQCSPMTTADRACVKAAGIDPRSIIARPDGMYMLGTGSPWSGTCGWNARLRAQAVVETATLLARHLGDASSAETDAHSSVHFIFLDDDHFAIYDDRNEITFAVPHV